MNVSKIKNIYAKWENLAPWVGIICFLLLIIPSWILQGWVQTVALAMIFPSFLTHYIAEHRRSNQRIYQKGYDDALEDTREK